MLELPKIVFLLIIIDSVNSIESNNTLPSNVSPPANNTNMTTGALTPTPTVITTTKKPLFCDSMPCLNTGACVDNDDGSGLCQCVGDFSGTFCQTDCKVNMSVTLKADLVYYFDRLYDNNLACEWDIAVSNLQSGNVVKLVFKNFSVEQLGYTCFADYLEVFTTTAKTKSLDKLCGYKNIDYPIFIDSNKFAVVFKTNENVQSYGFSATLDQVARTDAAPCDAYPCQNNANCATNSDGVTYRCNCLPGYTGQHCEFKTSGCLLTCLNGGTCIQLQGAWCQCKPGYYGRLCESQVPNKCVPNPCQYEQPCESRYGTFVCKCSDNFLGTLCETEVSNCGGNKCLNGAACVGQVGTYACACPLGFYGHFCEHEIVECASKPCLNGAQCVEQAGKFACTCLSGFAGKFCQLIFQDGRYVDASNQGNQTLGNIERINSSSVWCGIHFDLITFVAQFFTVLFVKTI